MIAIDDRQWFIFIHANQYYGPGKRTLSVEMRADFGNLCEEEASRRVLPTLHLFHYICDDKTPLRDATPLRPWEYPNLIQVGRSHLSFVPFRVRREFFPEREMAKKEQSAPFGILVRIFEIGCENDGPHAFVIIAIGGVLEIALQEFRDRLFFPDA